VAGIRAPTEVDLKPHPTDAAEQAAHEHTLQGLAMHGVAG
jgi:hypothetical protein